MKRVFPMMLILLIGSQALASGVVIRYWGPEDKSAACVVLLANSNPFPDRELQKYGTDCLKQPVRGETVDKDFNRQLKEIITAKRLPSANPAIAFYIKLDASTTQEVNLDVPDGVKRVRELLQLFSKDVGEDAEARFLSHMPSDHRSVEKAR